MTSTQPQRPQPGFSLPLPASYGDRQRTGLTDDDLSRAYRSQVDPRLNYEQALELAMLIARRAAPPTPGP